MAAVAGRGDRRSDGDAGRARAADPGRRCAVLSHADRKRRRWRNRPSPRRCMKVLKPVTVEPEGTRQPRCLPDDSLSYDFEIEFPASPSGGRISPSPSPRRLPGRDRARPHLRLPQGTGEPEQDEPGQGRLAGKHPGAGRYRGGQSRAPMRFADEFVRHKILDAIGDMALAGAPLLARFQGVNPAMPSTMPCCGRCLPIPPITQTSALPLSGHGPDAIRN